MDPRTQLMPSMIREGAKPRTGERNPGNRKGRQKPQRTENPRKNEPISCEPISRAHFVPGMIRGAANPQGAQFVPAIHGSAVTFKECSGPGVFRACGVPRYPSIAGPAMTPLRAYSPLLRVWHTRKRGGRYPLLPPCRCRAWVVTRGHCESRRLPGLPRRRLDHRHYTDGRRVARCRRRLGDQRLGDLALRNIID